MRGKRTSETVLDATTVLGCCNNLRAELNIKPRVFRYYVGAAGFGPGAAWKCCRLGWVLLLVRED